MCNRETWLQKFIKSMSWEFFITIVHKLYRVIKNVSLKKQEGVINTTFFYSWNREGVSALLDKVKQFSDPQQGLWKMQK